MHSSIINALFLNCKCIYITLLSSFTPVPQEKHFNVFKTHEDFSGLYFLGFFFFFFFECDNISTWLLLDNFVPVYANRVSYLFEAGLACLTVFFFIGAVQDITFY